MTCQNVFLSGHLRYFTDFNAWTRIFFMFNFKFCSELKFQTYFWNQKPLKNFPDQMAEIDILVILVSSKRDNFWITNFIGLCDLFLLSNHSNLSYCELGRSNSFFLNIFKHVFTRTFVYHFYLYQRRNLSARQTLGDKKRRVCRAM